MDAPSSVHQLAYKLVNIGSEMITEQNLTPEYIREIGITVRDLGNFLESYCYGMAEILEEIANRNSNLAKMI